MAVVRTESGMVMRATSSRGLQEQAPTSSSLARTLVPSSWAHVAKLLAGAGLLAAGAAVALGPLGGRGDSEARLPAERSGPERFGVAPALAPPPDPGSLWCFALMLPFGYEPELLEAQFGHGIGIFGCTRYAVFSNGTFTLRASGPTGSQLQPAPASIAAVSSSELVTLPIGGTLEVAMGGKWKTAMNTDIFVRVWTAVFLLGEFKDHAWTVKADPDCVFLPARLQQMLLREPEGAVYINNCKFGLHGPIEVLSRDAVLTYANSPATCQGVRDDAMDTSHPKEDEDHAFGEDEYLRRCLAKLGVGHVNEYDMLLSEQACGHWGETLACDAGKVSFHPFKGIDDYLGCWRNATSSPGGWDQALAAAPKPALAPWRPSGDEPVAV